MFALRGVRHDDGPRAVGQKRISRRVSVLEAQIIFFHFFGSVKSANTLSRSDESDTLHVRASLSIAYDLTASLKCDTLRVS